MKYINLTIDGIAVKAQEGDNLVQAAKRAGITIPTLCYLKELEVVSACRMCLVKIEGWNKLATACSVPAQEGMVVETETEEIVAYRKDLLRLYLDNHPNDCLTCQKAGECELQNLAYRYDVKFRDHDGERRGKSTAEFSDTSSPYILRDESKCILCGRCVRSCGQVKTRAVLTFAERGFRSKIAADCDQSLEESTCVSCNRCVSVCPVGALLDRRAQGKFRKWASTSKKVKCKRCDYGCNMEIIYDGNRPVAVRASEPNGDARPLCLLGRLTTELEYVDKPSTPYIKKKTASGNKFEEASWAKALELEGVMAKLKMIEEE